jgi:hypothetical protein
MLQVVGKGLANIGRQRQFGPPSALTANCDLAQLPIDIFEIQANDFGGAEPKSGKQHQNGVITPSARIAPVSAP